MSLNWMNKDSTWLWKWEWLQWKSINFWKSTMNPINLKVVAKRWYMGWGQGRRWCWKIDKHEIFEETRFIREMLDKSRYFWEKPDIFEKCSTQMIWIFIYDNFLYIWRTLDDVCMNEGKFRRNRYFEDDWEEYEVEIDKSIDIFERFVTNLISRAIL